MHCIAHTWSGRGFDFDACLRGDEVTIDFWDIAHALSSLARFGGHAREVYTVAQHSVLVAIRAEHLAVAHRHPRPSAVGAAALMHDGREAYVGDLIRPIRQRPEMEFYRTLEAAVGASIDRHFGLATDDLTQRLVTQADDELLAVEARDLLSPSAFEWAGLVEAPAGMRIAHVWEPAAAYRSFALHAQGVGLLDEPGTTCVEGALL